MNTGRASRIPREAPMLPAPAGFADAIDGFLSYVELEKGLARNTARSYESDLKQAAHQLKALGAAGWTQATVGQLTGWLHWLSDEKFSESSQARKLTAVRMLCRHLVREGLRADDPTALLSGPKFRRKLPQTLSAGEMDRFEIRQDLFGFGEELQPRWRIGLNYEFIKRLWMNAGVDDIINRDRRDYFVGLQLRFNDQDLKTILPFAPKAP